jgi:flagellar biosynthesis protein FliR
LAKFDHGATMISFSEAQILAWITPMLWPFLRALALFSSLPVLGSRTVPMRARIGLAAFIALAAQPSLPASAPVLLDSMPALMLVAQQLIIGVTLGFAVRLVFTAVEFAGELIGLQMGLNFAGFFDPLSATTATATSRFFGTMVAWLFVCINGHLWVIAALVQSFTAFPVSPTPLAFLHQMQPHLWGAEIFSTGLWIALPLITMLLFVNLVLGAISRVAPQINIFAIGFPVTLGVGLLGLLLTLPALEQPFVMTLEKLLDQFR